MNFVEYKNLVKSDLYRYCGNINNIVFFKIFLSTPGFKYTFILRTAAYLKNINIMFPFYIIARLLLVRYEYKYGISIPYNTQIGPGFYIGHFGGIIINYEVKIGSNCNVNHEVTIGKSYGGKNPGTPTVGDQVYFGPGCKVFGSISIGNHVAIGANCVVSSIVPDNAVVVGIPGKIISFNGSGSYIVNIVSNKV